MITIEGANIHSLPVVNEEKVDGDLRPQIRKWMHYTGTGTGIMLMVDDDEKRRRRRGRRW